MNGAAQVHAELRRALVPRHERWRAGVGQIDAAVVVPLVGSAADPTLLFVKRRDDLRHHAGQFAFPGGVRDGDETPLECALREFEEELGVPRTRAEVLGSLPCHASSAGFLVHPFVAVLGDAGGLHPQAAEVELVLEVPLAKLRQEQRWEWRELPGPDGIRRCPFFVDGAHVIWGLTARVVHDLVARWP